MRDEINETATNLAVEHWEYIENLLRVSLPDEQRKSLTMIAFHYQTAFVHGFKHGVEWEREVKDDMAS